MKAGTVNTASRRPRFNWLNDLAMRGQRSAILADAGCSTVAIVSARAWALLARDA